jgi:hypothetical protein
MKRFFMGLMLMAAAFAAQADAPRLRFLGSAAYGWGGETVTGGSYIGGQTYELLAGTGWTWTVGGDLRIFDRLHLQASVGQQRNRINGNNFDIDFVRNPVELMAFVSTTEQFRVGLGVHKSYNVRATGTGVAQFDNGMGTYDGSVGSVLEFQYLFWPPSKSERAAVWGMNVRFIKESFTLATPDSGTGAGAVKNADQMAVGLVFYY